VKSQRKRVQKGQNKLPLKRKEEKKSSISRALEPAKKDRTRKQNWKGSEIEKAKSNIHMNDRR